MVFRLKKIKKNIARTFLNKLRELFKAVILFERLVLYRLSGAMLYYQLPPGFRSPV